MLKSACIIAILASVFLFASAAQCANGFLQGKVLDRGTGQPIIGATVMIGENGTQTNHLGTFGLKVNAGSQQIHFRSVGYSPLDTQIVIPANDTVQVQMSLLPNNALLNQVTISANRFATSLAEATITTQVVKSQLIENTNSTSVDEVLTKIPGLDIVDGQPSIRGGAGYAYGAGSRVLLLIDDIPFLQADAGFPHWDDVPVENIARVEVLKGAGSALYGSSALNGVINIKTANASAEPYTKITAFAEGYGAPNPSTQQWWNERPFAFGSNVAHRSQHGKLDLLVGGNGIRRQSFNRGFQDDYRRMSLGLKYQLSPSIKFGMNANANLGRAEEFFFWKGIDSLYVGSPGTRNTNNYRRINVDPYFMYISDKGYRHRLLTRYHNVRNQSNNNQSNQSQLGYAEYQLQKSFDGIGLQLSAGIVGSIYNTTAQLYGDTSFLSHNAAAYAQLNKQVGKRLSISGGIRWEQNGLYAPEVLNCRTDPITGLEVCDTVPNGGRVVDARPVFRFGANYRAAKATFIRASWGQGYRFPTIAERFVSTTFGGIPISPNPELVPETGWSAELGVKQGFEIGKLQGFADVSLFWSQYQNMIEFYLANLFPTGFQSVNVGNTDIKGVEVSVMGQGTTGAIEHQFLVGYTYIDPRFQEFDASAQAFVDPQNQAQRNAAGSSSQENVLKYRFEHTAKSDWQMSYNSWSWGVYANYNSFMQAIDATFETFIVPGLQEFREENNSGNWVLGLRIGRTWLDEKLTTSILVNNLTNTAYTMRPGLMEAPRSVVFRVAIKA